MICSKCGEDKSENDFYLPKTSGNYFSRGRQCKTCQRKKVDEYNIINRENVLAKKRKAYQNNKTPYYENWLKRSFGISLNEYNSMLDSQGGVCAICGTKENRNLAVDHDHNTGKIRGLLCTNCNTAIGSFKDDINIMERAINYMKERV
jgi:hypothetical protein